MEKGASPSPEHTQTCLSRTSSGLKALATTVPPSTTTLVLSVTIVHLRYE